MIPTQHNCPHSPDGWCLECVKALADERDALVIEKLEYQKILSTIESLVCTPKYPLYSTTFHHITD